MSFVQALQCKECKTQYPKQALHVCENCFGPLEVAYDYAAIGKALTRETIMSRAPNLWRYRELLPLDAPPTVGLNAGYTPLVRAKRLGDALGLSDLWVKNDAVSHPTLSFKDRVVSVALSKAKELGFDTVACASTGNLGNSTAAHAAQAGLRCYVLIPHDLEAGKVLGTQIYAPHLVRIDGTYDDVNRLCSEIADRHPWAFVNVNIRPYYAEGSKTYGYEIQEQLGWRTPAHVVVPMASGSLLTKIGRAIDEFTKLGLVDARGTTKLHGAQAAGCGPIAEAVLANREAIKPVKKPNTIAKSLGHRQSGRRAVRGARDSDVGRQRGRGQRRRDHRGHSAVGGDRGPLHRDRRRRDRGDGEEAGGGGQDRTRRDDRHLHHGQRPEDAGAARGRAAAAAADRGPARRVREDSLVRTIATDTKAP